MSDQDFELREGPTGLTDDQQRRLDEDVDEQSRESFPASDPPSFTPVTGTGAPVTGPPQSGSVGR